MHRQPKTVLARQWIRFDSSTPHKVTLPSGDKTFSVAPLNIIVTGGAGYIGSICSARLVDDGHNVTIVDDLSTGYRAAIPPGAKFHHIQVGDAPFLRKIFEKSSPDAILHFAGSALVGESMINPHLYFRNNLIQPQTLLQLAAEFKTPKFIFSTTCAIYGVPSLLPISEDTPLNPVNPYGESKAMFERLLHWQTNVHATETVILRYFNAAGAIGKLGQYDHSHTRIIPRLFKTVLGQHKSFPVYGTNLPTPDGTAIRDYIHVSDLAEAHCRALKPGIAGAFNLGRGHGTSVRELLEAARTITGHPIPSEDLSVREGDPPELVASVEKAHDQLEWQAQHLAIEEIIESAWQWHQKFPNGYSD